MFKKIALGLFALLLFAKCNTKPESFEINGQFTGEIENGTKVFLKTADSLARNLIEVDTAAITNGTFQFQGKVDEPRVHYIMIDGQEGNSPLIVENGNISFEAQKDSLAFAKVKGTPQNVVFMEYLDEGRKMASISKSFSDDLRDARMKQDTAAIESLREEYFDLQEQAKNYELDFIKKNPDALISVLILDKTVTTKALSVKELKELFDILTPEIKATETGKRVEKKLKELSVTAIGSPAPEFSGPTPTGDVLALNEVKGKVILVDFWAAWCKPCRRENPNIVSVYNKYKDKGLNIVGVSLDRKAEDWTQAIAADGLEWNHISNLQYFQDPIAKMYNINAIPAAFLLDENGVIIAKNLRGPALEEKVAELLD